MTRRLLLPVALSASVVLLGGVASAAHATHGAANQRALWRTVATWAGDSTGNTQPFTVDSAWRIVWFAKPGTTEKGNFVITVNRPGSSLPVDMVGNIVGTGHATSYESGRGTFMLNIAADEDYRVVVQTKAASVPPQPRYRWTTVRKFTGNATGTTASFHATSPWRVVWTSAPGPTGAGNFQVSVQHPGQSLPVDMLANVTGRDHGTAYEYASGLFNRSITADENYQIAVQQGRPVR